MSVILTQRRETSEIELKLSEFKFKEADELFYELTKWNHNNQEVLDKYEKLRRVHV